MAAIRTRLDAPVGMPTTPMFGRRPSIVVETEPRPALTLIVSPAKVSPYSWPSADRSSTRMEMKGGTRTRRGVIRPPSPVKSASERAGSSSPPPPGWSSGEVEVSVSGGSSAVGGGTVSVVVGLGLGLRGRRRLLGRLGLRLARGRGLLVVAAAAGEGEHERGPPERGERPIEGECRSAWSAEQTYGEKLSPGSRICTFEDVIASTSTLKASASVSTRGNVS